MSTKALEHARVITVESIREIAELDENEHISDDQKLNEDLGIDSLKAVDLVIFIERELNIVMPEAEVTKVKTVGDLFALISNLVEDGAAV